MIEFKKPYDRAYGFWHVTTEGDCEGRSTTDLGVFKEISIPLRWRSPTGATITPFISLP